MNTDYKKVIPLLGTTPAGIDLAQLFIAPTITWKVTPSNIIGLSVNLAYQRFEAKGLQNFQAASTSPTNVTNNGHDNSYGAGFHIGWIGLVSDTVTLGATYQSRTYMSNFDKADSISKCNS
jgi:long-chain fatty acid transport protein